MHMPRWATPVFFSVVACSLSILQPARAASPEWIAAVDKVDAPAYLAHSSAKHELQMLFDNEDSFLKRLQMVSEAEHTVDVEYFLYGWDHVGREFMALLIDKARRGVKVRILLDYAPYYIGISPFLAEELRKFGIEVRYYNESHILNFFQRRNHRKLIVVDGKQGLLGGRNLDGQYLARSTDYHFIDRDVWVRGPVVANMQMSFDAYWNSPDSKVIDRAIPPKLSEFWNGNGGVGNAGRQNRGYDRVGYERAKREFAKDKVEAKASVERVAAMKVEIPEARARTIGGPVYISHSTSYVSDAPLGVKHDGDRLFSNYFYRLLRSAKKSVSLEAPYLILTGTGHDTFEHLIDAKIDLRVLTNSRYSIHPDYRVIGSVMEMQNKNYVRRGVPIFGYSGIADGLEETLTEFHGKTAVIDGDTSIISSFNFDPRSQDYNTELGLVIHDNPEVATALLKAHDDLLARSYRLDERGRWPEAEAAGRQDGLGLLFKVLKHPAFWLRGML